jgi:hypothetical protein
MHTKSSAAQRERWSIQTSLRAWLHINAYSLLEYFCAGRGLVMGWPHPRRRRPHITTKKYLKTSREISNPHYCIFIIQII